jgi:hypothetical protein
MTSNAGFKGPQQLPRSARPQLTYNDYSIGVICALAVEKAAFVAMLDDVHEALPTPKNDDNSYTFGRIGDHNIVAACLPAGMTGNNSAATVAKDMLRSFPIKIGLGRSGRRGMEQEGGRSTWGCGCKPAKRYPRWGGAMGLWKDGK